MIPCLVAIGANAGVGLAANARIIAKAVRQMPGRVVVCSGLYRTPAFPPGAGPDFVNAVVALHTALPPRAVLDRLHAIEDRHGRIRDVRWGARVLDLDLLAVGQSVVPNVDVWRDWHDRPAAEQATLAPDRMILPHPRLQDRAFVLIPLLDVAPGWRHPVTGRTVRAMADGMSGAARREVRAIGPTRGVVNRNLRA